MKTLAKSTLVLICLGIVVPAMADHHPDHNKGDWMMEKCDKDKDGKISEMEFLDSKKEHFKIADKNSDGTLDSSEVKEMHKDIHKKMKKGKKEGPPENDD